MLVNNKKIKFKEVEKTDLAVKNFDLDLSNKKNQTDVFYNYSVKNNTLIQGYGFSAVKLPVENGSDTERSITVVSDSRVLDLWQYRYYDSVNNLDVHKIFWRNGNNVFEYFNIFSYIDVSSELTSMSALPDSVVGINYHLEGDNFMLFSIDNYNYKLYNTSLAKFSSTLPQILDMCYGYDKIFVIYKGEQVKVHYSSTLNPFDLTSEENFINTVGERGKSNKLMYFDDYVYIFRDYGITKLSKYSSTDTFSVYDLYLSSSLIYKNTIVKCGDNIVFLERNGLKIFNGESTKNINLGIEDLLNNIDNKNAVACFNNGKYFLALKLNFPAPAVGCENYENGYINNALISYDVNSGELKIMRGVDIYSLLSVNTGNLTTVLASFNGQYNKQIGRLDNTGKIFGTNLLSEWCSKEQDFDCPEILKVANKIFVKSVNNCTITITSDLDEQVLSVVGNTKIQAIKIKVKGHYFKIKITSNNNAEIYPPKLKILKIKEK